MVYDVKLTVAAKPRPIAHWLHPIEARNPDEAAEIARRRWAVEWSGNLPETEMRVYVYEAGRGEVLNQAFRFDRNQVPVKL
jgi:hypothetical protein